MRLLGCGALRPLVMHPSPTNLNVRIPMAAAQLPRLVHGGLASAAGEHLCPAMALVEAPTEHHGTAASASRGCAAARQCSATALGMAGAGSGGRCKYRREAIEDHLPAASCCRAGAPAARALRTLQLALLVRLPKSSPSSASARATGLARRMRPRGTRSRARRVRSRRLCHEPAVAVRHTCRLGSGRHASRLGAVGRV